FVGLGAGPAGPAACARHAGARAARGGAAGGARGHELCRREPCARHSDGHGDVASLARSRAAAARDGCGARASGTQGGDMSEQDDAQLKALLKKHFDPVATEPIPARMYMRRPPWIRYAKAAMLVAAGIAIGLALPYFRPAAVPVAAAQPAATFPMRAARAHLVYAPEVRHPVEVDATQQEHLVKWLSKRLGLDLKVPLLTGEGFELLGGRLLPGPEGPVAQFMYQDSAGKRLTL